jgi:formylglycine-generating enzyme required for sulfatase activity
VDEVVKVGRKGTAFWIDRYEASIWSDENGGGQQYGISGNVADFPTSFPANGQVTTPLYALSRVGVKPSTTMTWFQANEACRASGKRLPSSDEWFAAARGTQDPGDSMGTGGTCVTKGGTSRNTGGGTQCVSVWGAQDMVGNVDEDMAEWQAGPGNGMPSVSPWPAAAVPGYGGDYTISVASSAFVGPTATVGMPSIVSRGGENTRGVQAGVFYMDLTGSPVSADSGRGFRCVIPR